MKQGQFERLYETNLEDYECLLVQIEQKKYKKPLLDKKLGKNVLRQGFLKQGSKKYLHASSEKTIHDISLEQFSQLYRKVCHYHSLAKSRRYSSFLVDRLGDLVVRGHRQLYQQKRAFTYHFIAFFIRDFPLLVRSQWRVFLLASALLYVPALILSVLVVFVPESVYTVLPPDSVSGFESMYRPENRTLGEAREAETNWYMFGFYIQNNISVAFRTFASGIIFGLGSIFLLFFNGLLLGAASGHMINVEYTQTFFTFVIGHGSFELTAICIAGAAGLKLGYALLSPGNNSRIQALKNNAQIAIRLVYGVIVMLVIAAFIEAFWSSNNMFSPVIKYTVGAFLWLLVGVYLGWGGRRFVKP